MKKKDIVANAIILVLVISIIVLVILRFFINKSHDHLKEPTQIILKSFENEDIALSELLDSEIETYMLVLKPNNCPPCVYEGIEDLKGLKKAGKLCFVVVVHNYLEDAKGWSQNYDFSPFYVLPKNAFYEYFHLSALPAVLKIKDGKVKNVRYITN